MGKYRISKREERNHLRGTLGLVLEELLEKTAVIHAIGKSVFLHAAKKKKAWG